jgi:hypothetical protein
MGGSKDIASLLQPFEERAQLAEVAPDPHSLFRLLRKHSRFSVYYRFRACVVHFFEQEGNSNLCISSVYRSG